jgi:alkylated DNA repair dioxygenase AlkB
VSSLFDDGQDGSDPAVNLLPRDGVLRNHGRLFSAAQADAWLDALLQHTPWQHDEVNIAGQRRQTARQVAWMADWPWTYTYSGVARQALPWTSAVLAIKAQVQAKTGCAFNACLLNLYPDGQCGMA